MFQTLYSKTRVSIRHMGIPVLHTLIDVWHKYLGYLAAPPPPPPI